MSEMLPAATPSTAVLERPDTSTQPRGRWARTFGSRKRLAKAGVLACAAAATALTISSCSPNQLTWYPLATPGVVTQGFSASHPGVDFYVPYGTAIHAANAGVVTQAGWWYGYGNYTCIQRDAGFKSCYAHQSVIYAHVGLRVTPGQTIGLVGGTGDATGPHLHFEIYRFGHVVNPLPYLPPR